MKLSEIVKNNTVQFDSYRAGFFYYNVEFNNNTYQFPVPIEDIGQATMMAQDKAMLFMRWIRKAIANEQFIQIENTTI